MPEYVQIFLAYFTNINWASRLKGRTITQAVSRWLPIAAALLRSQVR
jgi:hypothetical protein